MKIRTLFTLILLQLTSYSSFAQSMAPNEMAKMSKWQFNQIDAGLGIDNDHYGSMSYDDLMAFAKSPAHMERDLQGLEEDISTIAYGLAFYANASFAPLDFSKGTYRNDRELRLGIGLHAGKEAMLTYRNETTDTSIVYCNVQSEFSIEGAYLFKGQWGRKFHYYYGVGANIGTTFHNEMMLIAGRYFGPDDHPSTQESDVNNIDFYAAKQVSYSRLYIPYGISYSLGTDLKVGFDFRTGIGVQKIEGEEANFIQKTGAFVIGAKYQF